MGTYLSLFSGIGGLDLAVEAHGFRCVGQVELDEACTRVLERHWPSVPRWGDVHGFTAAAYTERRELRHESGRGHGASGSGEAEPRSHDAPRPDLICGGYPCQPFSHAGKRGGTEDPRHLWPEFARIAGELRPRWLLLENVPGHLSLGGHQVLADLAALGYDATWTTLRASDVGAPHRRERWFCLAENDQSDAPDTEGERRERGRPTRRRGAGSADFAWGTYQPAIERWERVMGPAPHPVDEKSRLSPTFVEWMMGFPAGWTEGMTRTQSLKALGNAVVPHQGAAAVGLLDATRREYR